MTKTMDNLFGQISLVMKLEGLGREGLQFFAQTTASDLVNPEVMQAAMPAKLEKAIKFTKYADVDRDLVGQPGDTLSRPKYGYIGAADDLEEGVAIQEVAMSMTTGTVTIKETGKAVTITEKAILTNVAGTVAEAERQLALSMGDKVDIDYVAELEKALQVVAKAPTSIANILEGITLFNAEGDLNLVLFINPTDYTTLLTSLFAVGGNIQQQAVTTGQVANILGIKAIERTKRVPVGKGYLQQFADSPDDENQTSAMEIVLKQDVNVNRDGDILKRTVTIATNAYYVVNLKNDKGVVKFAAPTVPAG